MTIPSPNHVLDLLRGEHTGLTPHMLMVNTASNQPKTQISAWCTETIQLPDTGAELVSWLALAIAHAARETEAPGIAQRPDLKKVTARRLPVGNSDSDRFTRYEYRLVEYTPNPRINTTARTHRTITVTLHVENINLREQK